MPQAVSSWTSTKDQVLRFMTKFDVRRIRLLDLVCYSWRCCKGLRASASSKHNWMHNFVHRDIRLDNVVKAMDGWLLIDWELAGRANQIVWWEGKLLPDLVKHRLEPYTCKTYLWLIRTTAVSADVAITSFADRLLAGDFATAAIAQASL